MRPEILLHHSCATVTDVASAYVFMISPPLCMNGDFSLNHLPFQTKIIGANPNSKARNASKVLAQ